MDKHSAVLVFTGRSFDRIVREGGSQAWVLDPGRARRCEYLVCTQNRYAGDWSDPEAAHGSAFMVAKISGVENSKEDTARNRFIIRISEAARIKKDAVWDGSRNPVRYTTLEELGIDLSNLEFERVLEPTSEASDGQHPSSVDNDGPVRALTIQEAKQGLALAFGVSPDAVEITIRG